VKDYVRALAPPAAPASDRLGSADPASRQKLRPPFRNPMIAKWLALQETLGRLVSRLPCRQAERVRQHGLNPSRLILPTAEARGCQFEVGIAC
jgi:hypothetical protein